MAAELFPDGLKIIGGDVARGGDKKLHAKRAAPRVRAVEEHVLQLQFAFEHLHSHV